MDAVGELIRPNYVSDHFPIVLRKNGLRKIRFHDLDIGTTSNVYSHVDSESKKLSAEAIAKALSNESTAV